MAGKLGFGVLLWTVMLSTLAWGQASLPASVPGSDRFVFAVSWQPAFCETKRSRPECKNQVSTDLSATHFTLHGLWATGRKFCGVGQDVKDKAKKNWLDLPALTVSQTTQAELNRTMPGRMSGLERYQWLAYGTCTGLSQQAYFDRTLEFLKDVNASPVREILAESIGKTIRLDQIQTAFNTAFGAGAGGKVRLRCRKLNGQALITGITIGLRGDIGSSDLPILIGAAQDSRGKCTEGLVDAVGFTKREKPAPKAPVP